MSLFWAPVQGHPVRTSAQDIGFANEKLFFVPEQGSVFSFLGKIKTRSEMLAIGTTITQTKN